MSLKAFHLVFITASTMLALGFAVWSGLQYAEVGGTMNLTCGIGSVLCAGGLVWYGKYFLKKLKNVSYL
jgi:hypothetical protein